MRRGPYSLQPKCSAKAWCLKPTFQFDVIRKWRGRRAVESYVMEAMKERPRPLLFLFYFTAESQGDQLPHHLPTESAGLSQAHSSTDDGPKPFLFMHCHMGSL